MDTCSLLGIELSTRAKWDNPGAGVGIDMDLRLTKGWPATPTQVRLVLPSGMPLALPVTHSVVVDDGAFPGLQVSHNLLHIKMAQGAEKNHGRNKGGEDDDDGDDD